MSLSRLRPPLTRLLGDLLHDNPDGAVTIDQSLISIDLSNANAEPSDDGSRRTLLLDGPSVEHYRECLQIMHDERSDGDLEYLSVRDVPQLLDRIVAETWNGRDQLSAHDIPQRVKSFIATHRDPPRLWEVAWQIENLTVAAELHVAGVTFFAFTEDVAIDWLEPLGQIASRYQERAIGSAFARTVVRAGSKEHALDRVREQIDDALHVLRVAMLSERIVRPEQRLQRRGRIRMARQLEEPLKRHWGAGIEEEPFKLELTPAAVERLQPKCETLSYSFDHHEQSRFIKRLSRAVLWIGSSLSRTNPDDGVLDLCASLETLLAVEQDKRKAEAISARYLLLVLTVGEPSSFTHPLDLYGLYLLRNQIVHGSSRRVASQQDVETLRRAARDTVDRTRMILQAQTDIRQHKHFLRLLLAPRTLQRALAIVEPYPRRNGDAVDNVYNLLRLWSDPASTPSEECP